MSDKLYMALMQQQIAANMPALQKIMAHADQHSTRDQHDRIVNILADCVLEIFGVLPDADRRADYLRNVQKQERLARRRGQLDAAKWYNDHYRMVRNYFSSYRSFVINYDPDQDASKDASKDGPKLDS